MTDLESILTLFKLGQGQQGTTLPLDTMDPRDAVHGPDRSTMLDGRLLQNTEAIKNATQDPERVGIAPTILGSLADALGSYASVRAGRPSPTSVLDKLRARREMEAQRKEQGNLRGLSAERDQLLRDQSRYDREQDMNRQLDSSERIERQRAEDRRAESDRDAALRREIEASRRADSEADRAFRKSDAEADRALKERLANLERNTIKQDPRQKQTYLDGKAAILDMKNSIAAGEEKRDLESIREHFDEFMDTKGYSDEEREALNLYFDQKIAPLFNAPKEAPPEQEPEGPTSFYYGMPMLQDPLTLDNIKKLLGSTNTMSGAVRAGMQNPTGLLQLLTGGGK